MTLFKLIVASILLITLPACGGGKNDPLSGVFLDSTAQGFAVQGLTDFI